MIEIFQEETSYFFKDYLKYEVIYILTDYESVILDYQCLDELRNFLKKTGLKKGTQLSLNSCGPNTVALAIDNKMKIFLKEDQHYYSAFWNLKSIAKPIIVQ